MSHNNDSRKFFKFKNLQLVRKPNTVRQSRQNTDLSTHGSAEEQFAAITATARADALREIDNISSVDESVDYSPPEHLPLEPQVSVRDNGQQISDSDETNKRTPEIATDSSLVTSSIEVIQPNKALAIIHHNVLRPTLLKAQGQMSQSLHHKISSQKMKTQKMTMSHPPQQRSYPK